MEKTKWQGKHVLMIGAARQGVALTRYLCKHGVSVTLNDMRSAEQLTQEQQSLKNYDVHWVFGEHTLTLLDAQDCVCVSGGVPLTNPLVVEAVRRGLMVTNDSQLFLDAAPCLVIGISGSAGKTTTTTLLGRMVEAARGWDGRDFCVWVGGNLGNPLIAHVDDMRPEDIAVCELSSFQLELMTAAPEVAAILNITPNHLDRHVTMQAYTAAKTNILVNQHKTDSAVLCREDEGSWRLKKMVKGALLSFGKEPINERQDGTFLEDDVLKLRRRGRVMDLMTRDVISLRGEHNLMNSLAACALAAAVDLPPQAMQLGVKGFTGVAHRLELVREIDGVQWFNDSIATAPERTLAAISSFDEPLLLLLGGRDKKLPWEELAQVVQARVKHLLVFGEAGEMIAKIVESQSNNTAAPEQLLSIQRCKNVKQAVQVAASLSQPDDVILFSPGGTSFDEFTDFEERGERFRAWVNELSI